MGCTGFTIVGGVFEVFGFGLIAWELARIQRREFGTPAVIRRIQGWVRRLLGRTTTHEVGVADSIGLAGKIRARGRARTPPGASLEDRVAALEKNFEHLEREFDERTAEMDQEFDQFRNRLTELRSEFDRQIQEREEERRESLRASVQLQALGTGLFVVGAVLSVLGNTLSC